MLYTRTISGRSINRIWRQGLLGIVASMILASVQAQDTTTVYKVVNPDGSVTFSDQPSDNAQRLEVAPVATVPALKMPSKGTKKPSDSKPVALYQSLEILSPAHDTAFYSGNGEVQVSVNVSPGLRGGHQLRYALDGQVIATQSSTNLTLTTVDRGTHSLSVTVVDGSDNVLLSGASTFTIHRPVVKRP